jgi:hypothetical protein
MAATQSIFPTFFLSGFECSSFLWGGDRKRRDLSAELQHYGHATRIIACSAARHRRSRAKAFHGRWSIGVMAISISR